MYYTACSAVLAWVDRCAEAVSHKLRTLPGFAELLPTNQEVRRLQPSVEAATRQDNGLPGDSDAIQ